VTNYEYICKERYDLVEKCLSDGGNQGIRIDVHTGVISLCMTSKANNCSYCKFGHANNSDHESSCKNRVVEWLKEEYTGSDCNATDHSQNTKGEITW
jgi:hypothetical protein